MFTYLKMKKNERKVKTFLYGAVAACRFSKQRVSQAQMQRQLFLL